MNDTIPKIIAKIEKKENLIKVINNEIKELKKNKENSSHKEKEKRKLEDDIQVLWTQILNRIPSFINGENQKEMIESCQEFGRRFSDNDLSTSQIRNVYGEVKKIQMKNSMLKENEKMEIIPLRMLLPKLAYSAARAKKKGTDELKDVLSKGIETVLEDENNSKEIIKRFEMFSNFFEALLAYHKAEGGN
ncbi:MAG: type III-A CRISPR-associated protein Csm2 [Ignavibacteriaceae bacterium]|nr:type III-A CRISPR-associated protein Csm2 [Ignavibacteriaceae bacterium]